MSTLDGYLDSLHLPELQNGEHLNAHNSLFIVIQARAISELSSIMPLYHAAKEEENSAYARLKKEDMTRLVENTVRERAKILRGVVHQVKAYTYYPDETMCAAAYRVLNMVETYKKDCSSNHKKTTEAVDNMLQHACGTTGDVTAGMGGGMGGGTPTGGTGYLLPYSADVVALNMPPWFDHVKQINDTFKAIYAQREADRSHVLLMKKMKDARKKTDKIFRTILKELEFLVATNGIDQYASLISQINVILKEWNNTLARRKAAAKKRKEKAEAANANNGETNANAEENTPPANNENSGVEPVGEDNGGENGEDDGFGDENTPSANA